VSVLREIRRVWPQFSSKLYVSFSCGPTMRASPGSSVRRAFSRTYRAVGPRLICERFVSWRPLSSLSTFFRPCARRLYAPRIFFRSIFGLRTFGLRTFCLASHPSTRPGPFVLRPYETSCLWIDSMGSNNSAPAEGCKAIPVERCESIVPKSCRSSLTDCQTLRYVQEIYRWPRSIKNVRDVICN
jgi:hypothetical protein